MRSAIVQLFDWKFAAVAEALPKLRMLGYTHVHVSPPHASNPAVWRDILMANREEILKQTQRFRHTLDAMEHVVKTGNTEALEALIVEHYGELDLVFEVLFDGFYNGDLAGEGEIHDVG